MQSQKRQSPALYWMVGMAVLLLASVAMLLVPLERREEDVRRKHAILSRVHDLEQAYTRVQQTLDGDDHSTLEPQLRDCELRLHDVEQLFEVGRGSPALATKLRHVQDETAGLVGSTLLYLQQGTPESHLRALHETEVAIETIDDFMNEMTRHVSLSHRRNLWTLLYMLVGVSTLLLVWIAIAQARVAREMRRLYYDHRALMESTPQVLLSVDSHGSAVRWNERLAQATGLTPEALHRLSIVELFETSARPAVVQAIDTALDAGFFECDLPLLCHGEPLEYAWVFSRNDPDRADSWLTISGYDVSSHRHAERQLRLTEGRYRDLFESIRDAVFISEGDRFLEANQGMEEMFGYSREELARTRPVDIYEKASDRLDYIAAIDRNGGSVSDYAVRLRRKDGRVLDCILSATATRDEAGQWHRFQGVIRDVSEKHRLEEALSRSEADYRGLFEHAHDAIIILDPETVLVLDANPRACLLYGFSHEEFVGTSMLERAVNPGRGRDYVRRTIEGTGKYLPFESQQRRRDGSVVEVEIQAAQVMYQGRIAILSINRDVTERRREERRVRESEERFRLLLENVVDYAIYMLDPEGRIVSWNEGAERILGFTADDVMNHSFAMFYPAEQQMDGAPARHLAEAEANARIELEDVRVRKDGSVFHAAVVLTSVIDEQGKLRGFAKVTRDITQRKQLEETQREILAVIHNVATEWTRTFDAVSLPVILLDEEGRIRRLNHAAAQLSDQPLKTLLHRDPREVGGEPWQGIAAVSDFFIRHGITTEARVTDAASRRVWQISSTPVALEGTRRLIVVAYDLTAVTELEESLRRAQLTAALGALVAGVAHEVRNPLFTISATLDNCEARLSGVPELNQYTERLREEVNRLNELMEELLDYGRPHRLQPVEVSLADVVRAAISQSRAAAGRDVEVHIDCEDDLPILEADRRRLQQVFRNIIDNAIQHSSDEPVLVRLYRDGAGAVSCEVLDDGPGLSDEALAQAFTPFYTKRKGGTGLGLAIAQKLVHGHGGEITIRNRGGRGASVTVRLPALRRNAGVLAG